MGRTGDLGSDLASALPLTGVVNSLTFTRSQGDEEVRDWIQCSLSHFPAPLNLQSFHPTSQARKRYQCNSIKSVALLGRVLRLGSLHYTVVSVPRRKHLGIKGSQEPEKTHRHIQV